MIIEEYTVFGSSGITKWSVVNLPIITHSFCNNVLYLSTDSGDSVVLILLDLSAAFDTVDHYTLLSRLESWVGLKATVLNWLQSYLSDRTFLVKLGNFTSSPAPLSCGLPQGSILAPSLFSLYMLPLGSILHKHGVSFLHRRYSNLSTNQKKQFHSDYLSSAMFRGG